MNESETLAERYLNTLGIGEVVFEPDGNIPPDFVVGESIAVEVRRLNQNFEDQGGSYKGLEEIEIPVWRLFKKLLPNLGPSIEDESWYVAVTFRRPLNIEWKQLKKTVEEKLRTFRLNPSRQPGVIPVSANFGLELYRSGRSYESFFVFGASSDFDSGGFVLSEILRNLSLCIVEKEKKTAPYRNKYKQWWLLLPDYIDFSLDDEDRATFEREIKPLLKHSFDKIILIDPRNPSRAFEI